MASVRTVNDADGNFAYFEIRYTKYVDGRRTQPSLYAHTEAEKRRQLKEANDFEAAQRRDRKLAKLHGNDDGTFAVKEIPTFESYALDTFLPTVPGQSTAQQVESHLRAHLVPAWGAERIDKVTHTKALKFFQELHLAPTTVDGIMKTAIAVFGRAKKDFPQIKTNPMDDVPRPDVSIADIPPWEDEVVLRLLQDFRPNQQVFVGLGAWQGLRQGESFAFDPELDIVESEDGSAVVRVSRQIKLVRSRLWFAPPKHRGHYDGKRFRNPKDKPREIPLSPDMRRLIDSHLDNFGTLKVTLPYDPSIRGQKTDLDNVEMQTRNLLLFSRQGNAWNRNTFNEQVWWPSVGRIGLDDTDRDNGTHALRHYFAASLATDGISMAAIARYLGHADAAFTQRVYGRFSPQQSAHSADLLAARMERARAALAQSPAQPAHAAS